jgi:hypothetical protein
MLTRRDALAVVAAVLSRGQAQAQTGTCATPDTIVLDLGSPVGCGVRQIRVQQGAISATIPVSELLQALGAKLGG